MTAQQRATWRRVVAVCAIVAVGLAIAGLLVRDALPVLAPLAVTLGVFALLVGVRVRRGPRE